MPFQSTKHSPILSAQILLVVALVIALTLQPAARVSAAPLASTITVNTTADEYGTGANCSLREAITAANTNAAFGGCPAGSGLDVITLPAGNYVLTLANIGGINEDNNATGDLDIHDSLILQGAGMMNTVIDANDLDKVIAANPFCNVGVSVTIQDLTVRNGTNLQPYGSPDWSYTGGGIDWCGGTTGNFTMRNAIVSDNINTFGYGGGLNTDSVGGYNGTITLDSVTFQNNQTLGLSGSESNGAGLNLFGENPTVVIQNCTFMNNRAVSGMAEGGGMYLRLGYGGAITVRNTLVTGNTAGSLGGGIYMNYASAATTLLVDGNTQITNNVSGGSPSGVGGGSGIALDGVGNLTPARLSKIIVAGNTDNSAPSSEGGGGIFVGNASATIEYSRITGNITRGGASMGSGLYKSIDPGAVSATNNWWGCSTGPTATPCDTAVLAGGSAGSLTSAPYLRVVTMASPTTLNISQTSALTASLTTNSAGANMSGNLDRMVGLPITWSAAVGTISGQQAFIQADGTATATFTATQGGTQKAAAKVDNDSTITGPNVATLTVNKADTTTTITSDTPDPSLAGSPFTVSFEVLHNGSGTMPAMTGLVTVTDGVESCSAAVSAGSCALTLTTPGVRSLTASYAGDTSYNPSTTTTGTPHTVQKTPTFTSANATTFTVGTAGSFTVSTTGYPTAALSETGALPAGVTFVDNGDGTATLSGTPATGAGGVYSLTLTANNGAGGDVTQSFTLTVNEAPAFTSLNNVLFVVGTTGNFTISTSGYPAAAISLTGSLPAGLLFTDNGNGSATLSGAPAAGMGGEYALTFTANNGVGGDVTQSFTLSVAEAPAITSTNATTFTVGSAGSFTVTSTGTPAATISLTGSLPAGVTFADNGDGTAALSGTPTAGTGGVYNLSLGAANGVTPDATQTFTLTVNEAPAFTSFNNVLFVVGTSGSFTVSTSGYPAAAISLTGTLPAGVTFADNGNGTGTLSGTPAIGAGGSYALTFTANNGVGGDVTQNFTFQVSESLAFTSADSTLFTTGAAGSFTITTRGFPIPAITSSGSLPGGVTVVDNGNGTATLSGTPAAGSGGTYTLTLTADNSVDASISQTFTLTVQQAPAITSANAATFTAGTAGNFTVTSTGYPINTLTVTGTLPAGVSFADNGDNTAALSGTPAAGSGGSYPLTFTAANGAGSDAAQNFTLTVNEAPVITSAASVDFEVGTAGSFTITTHGYPIPVITFTSDPTLPASLTLTDNGNGTATLSGTPLAGDGGVYTLSLTAANGAAADATQTLTLTIGQAPTITSTDTATFTAGAAGNFTVTSTGYPVNTLAATGTLPAGVTFADNNNNTATLGGTPAVGSGGLYPLTFTAANGVGSDATQSFTLTVNEALAFTSADHTGFTVGSAGNFTIQVQGYPTATISLSGALPAGVSFADNGDGTASLTGTPAAGSNGSYVLTLSAANSAGDSATQAFTLAVSVAPTITSANSVTFVTGTPGTFTVTTTGDPTPAITLSGALPAGVTFTDNGNGTAGLAGTPTGAGATYLLTLTAANGVLPDATQSFTLTVEGPPGVTLVNSVADTGDGALTEGEHTPVAITQLVVTFNKLMNAAMVTDPANYSLQSGAGDGIIDSVVYDPIAGTATLGLNGAVALPDGAYTLTVKGNLQDTLGAPIGSDFVLHFVVDSVPPLASTILTKGNVVIAEGAVLNESFAQVQVQFSEDVSNPTGDGGADDVTNPANYLLFQTGADGTFETGSCVSGIASTDKPVATGPVVYTNNNGAGPFKAIVTLNNGAPLANGKYRLMLCGSTSIVDLAGNALGGGQDVARTFSVAVIGRVDEIPVTGFAPGVVSALPAQPAMAAYSDLGSLWIEIPSLGMQAAITGVPLQGDAWDVTWLYNQVGWLQGTAFPTWAGNTVLTAHAYTADGLPGPFAALRSLKYDETILLHYAGMKYTYALRNNILTAPDATQWITRHETRDWLTLITCQQFNEKTQAYDYRRVVRAVLLSVEADN